MAPSGEPWRADRPRSQKCHRGSSLSLSSAARPARALRDYGKCLLQHADKVFRTGDALDVDNIWECTKRENIKGICSKVFGISRSYLLL